VLWRFHESFFLLGRFGHCFGRTEPNRKWSIFGVTEASAEASVHPYLQLHNSEHHAWHIAKQPTVRAAHDNLIYITSARISYHAIDCTNVMALLASNGAHRELPQTSLNDDVRIAFYTTYFNVTLNT